MTFTLNKNTRIGWIGTGVMGVSMCGHLMAAGYKTTIYNRTQAKAAPLLDKGATWADSPKAVAEASDVIFTIVGFPKDVQEVYFNDNGVLTGTKSGNVLIDMTTTSPSLAVEIAKGAQERGAVALDAPVSGGDVGAKNAALSIMVGGDKPTFDAVLPLLELMGKGILHQGAAGAGQHTKMCNQIVISGSMTGMCQSLLYAVKAGLDPQSMLASVTKGSAGCWSLDNLAPRVLKGDFAPGFMIDHFIKDMGIALDEAKRMNISLPGLSLTHELYTEASKQGHGRDGTQALFLALEKLSS